ncbi:MAG: hypothetical protein JXA42_19600 [Anaerolineales bacterium]|nr:hypothetical protein [Anaerolineales bacterium]
MNNLQDLQLVDFWNIEPEQRERILVDAIMDTHAWHFSRNRAYRKTVTARGVGQTIDATELSRIIRPTALTFKSYIDLLQTPFPQNRPHAFLEWMADQLSVELPAGRFFLFKKRYPSMETLLSAIEIFFSDLGIEISTSSGTSGRASIMVRDQATIDKTVESFYLTFQRILGMRAEHRAIFMMPRSTRIAMVRMASFSVERVGIPKDRIHFTIPFPAHPDQVRIRTGRTFSGGLRGSIEKKILHPFMNLMNDRYITPRMVRDTLDLLRQAETAAEKVLLFGGWVHLHAIALALINSHETIRLAPGSILGTGGGLKELYPFTPAEIRRDLAQVIGLADGRPIPIRDVYGMAEGNWAAMQCECGNYHIPPWIYALTIDQDNRIQRGSDTTGLLAFFDPLGSGKLFPAFFKSADRVRLINGAGGHDRTMTCPCGEGGAFIVEESILRVDLLEEAGCAGQL